MTKQEETCAADLPIIVVVDDDPGVRGALCNLLDSAGYRSCVFDSGEALLASDCLGTALCAVVDVELSNMSGFELHRLLGVARPGLPLLFMSGHDSPSNHVRAATLGAAPLLVKPVDAEILLARIRHVLLTCTRPA